MLNPKQFRTGGLFGHAGKGSTYRRGEDSRWTRYGQDGSETTFDKTIFVHPDYQEGLKLHRGVPHYLPENSETHVPVPAKGFSSEPPKEGSAMGNWKPLSYNIEVNPANKAQWRPKDIVVGSGISSIE
jgi:hypothetical protein